MVYVLNKYGSLHDHLHDGEFYCALQHFSQLVPHVPVNIWIINSYGMACASLALVIVTNFGRYVSAHTAVSHRSGGNFHRFGHLLLCSIDGVKKLSYKAYKEHLRLNATIKYLQVSIFKIQAVI